MRQIKAGTAQGRWVLGNEDERDAIQQFAELVILFLDAQPPQRSFFDGQ